MSDQWSERLSDFLDEELSLEKTRRLEEHLESCASCRRTLEELRAVVARAGTLEDRPPPRDLWPGIEEAVRGGEVGPERTGVVELATARRGRGARFGRVALSVPQLVAAAVILLMVGSGATWVAAGALRDGPGGQDPGRSVGAGEAVSLVSTDPPLTTELHAAREMAELEETLARSRDQLDPNTVRIVERNLGIIDRAIRESRAALAVDPGNPFLEEHLEGALERKVDYLREATSLLRSS